MRIETGQLWQVVSSMFFTSGEHNKYKRPVKINKGEIIEIRFPYEWHFRTQDDCYFHATPESIIGCCIFVGKIWEKVRFNNKAKLAEILDLELYDKYPPQGKGE